MDQSEKLFALQLSQLGSLGNYPSADMDLLGHIRSDPDIYAQLLDTLDWIRLDSVPEKYDRALTSYLDYQGTVAEQLTDPSQKTLYEIAYIGGLGNPENLFLDMFPEAANTPQQVVDILAQQSDVADIIHQEIAQVDRQISAFDPRSSSVVTDLANRFTPSRPEVPEDTSARAYAITSEQQRHLTEGGESQEDPFG